MEFLIRYINYDNPGHVITRKFIPEGTKDGKGKITNPCQCFIWEMDAEGLLVDEIISWEKISDN